MSRLRRSVPSLGALATFEVAARLGGFTKAAGELGVTQAAVSRQIRCLEDELCTSLFTRSHRRVELTAAGRVLAEAVGQSFERIADAIEVLRQPEGSEALTVSATLAFSHFWLLPRLPSFRSANPNLKLRVMSADGAVDLRDGDVDVILRYGKPPFRDGSVVASLSESVFPVCSPDFAMRVAVDFPHRRLAELPLIDSDVPEPSWLYWRKWFALAGLGRAPEGGMLRFAHYSDAVYAAINGEGVVLGWRRLLERPLSDGRLVPLGDVSVEPVEGHHAVVPVQQSDKASVGAFVDWISSCFRSAALDEAPAVRAAYEPRPLVP